MLCSQCECHVLLVFEVCGTCDANEVGDHKASNDADEAGANEAVMQRTCFPPIARKPFTAAQCVFKHVHHTQMCADVWYTLRRVTCSHPSDLYSGLTCNQTCAFRCVHCTQTCALYSDV